MSNFAEKNPRNFDQLATDHCMRYLKKEVRSVSNSDYRVMVSEAIQECDRDCWEIGVKVWNEFRQSPYCSPPPNVDLTTVDWLAIGELAVDLAGYGFLIWDDEDDDDVFEDDD